MSLWLGQEIQKMLWRLGPTKPPIVLVNLPPSRQDAEHAKQEEQDRLFLGVLCALATWRLNGSLCGFNEK
jgi:hypothetical protein